MDDIATKGGIAITANGANGMTFLPADYEVPQSTGGNYFKPQKGDNKIRILTDCITGWVYWKDNGAKGTPVRLKDRPSGIPQDARIQNGVQDKPKHFWAMVVYDYASNGIKVWEVTQGTIQSAIAGLATDPEWGHPRNYDLKIRRDGDGLETEYTVTPSPAKPVSAAVMTAATATPINLYALYDGADPFDATVHSHSVVASIADAVAAMVKEAKAAGIDVRAICKAKELPIKPSEYDEAAMLRLEEHLQIALNGQAAVEDDDIPF